MSWNGTNPVVVGAATKKDHYDRAFDDLLLLKTSISDDGDNWLGDVIAADTKQIGYSDAYFSRVGPDSIKLWNGTTLGTLAVGPFSATTGSFSGLLTVSGLGTHSFSAGGTGANILLVKNTTAGASNYSALYLGNDASPYNFYAESFSSTYTTSGPAVAAGAILAADGAGGLSIAANHASGPIRFYSGGTTLRWTVLTSGNFYSASNAVVSDAAVPFAAVNVSSAAGTTAVFDANGYLQKLSSSLRYKTLNPLTVTPGQLAAFVALSPKGWDYIGQRNGAFGFLSEQLHRLPIRNKYKTSPLVNYDAKGRPDSNRDYALIALQHLAIQNIWKRVWALEHKKRAA